MINVNVTDNNQACKMLSAANERISDLIRENKLLTNKITILEKEVEYWKKKHEDCEYRKRFAETTDYER